MKKLLLLSCIISFLGCASKVQLARPLPFQEVAVVAFDITTEPIEGAEYEGKAGTVADIAEAVRIAGQVKEAIEIARQPEKSEWKAQLDSIYAIIANGLKHDLGIPLLPIDHLQGEVEYDLFGYPHGDIEQIVRAGKHAAVLAIFARISFAEGHSSMLNLVVWGKTKNVQIPKLALEVKMLDKTGKSIWRDSAKTASDIPVIVDEKWMFGIKYKSEQSVPALTDLFQKAILELVRKNQ